MSLRTNCTCKILFHVNILKIYNNNKNKEYEVTEDIVAGYSRAIANGQHGDGGFGQLFIEEYASVLEFIKSMPLVNRSVWLC